MITIGLLTWLVIGAIVGWLAGIAIKGKGSGLIRNVVIGAIGALLGGWVAGFVFNIRDPISGFNLTTFVVAFLGAVVVLYVSKMLKIG